MEKESKVAGKNFGKKKSWRALTARALLKELRTPTQQNDDESGYRSGVRDGWIHCLDALAKTMPASVYEAAWRFWADDLRAWMFQEPGTGYLPPLFTCPPGQKASSSTGSRTMAPSLRFAILQRDGYRCQLCGAAAADGPHVRLEVDHKVSRHDGGTDDPANLWVLCYDCNRGKGTESLQDKEDV